MYALSFGVTVEDSSKWPSWARQRAQDAGVEDEVSWALSGLEEAMRDAGERYIEQHADLFRSSLT